MNPIFCALDTSDLAKADALTASLRQNVGGIKLGLEFFMAHGADGYKKIAKYGLPIFLDLKLHDIPNTVKGALSSLMPLSPAFVTLHASGGTAMMKAAVDIAREKGAGRPKLLAVTVLTSLDSKDLTDIGQMTETKEQVVRLADLAQKAGMDGCICSPEEIPALRSVVGPDFILMVPGIRPAWAAAHDQKRVMTPRQALDAGATYLVIGRPITGSETPSEAALRITQELS